MSGRQRIPVPGARSPTRSIHPPGMRRSNPRCPAGVRPLPPAGGGPALIERPVALACRQQPGRSRYPGLITGFAEARRGIPRLACGSGCDQVRAAPRLPGAALDFHGENNQSDSIHDPGRKIEGTFGAVVTLDPMDRDRRRHGLFWKRAARRLDAGPSPPPLRLQVASRISNVPAATVRSFVHANHRTRRPEVHLRFTAPAPAKATFAGIYKGAAWAGDGVGPVRGLLAAPACVPRARSNPGCWLCRD